MTDVEIARLPTVDRLGEALRRSLPYLPGNTRQAVEEMLRPENLAMIAGVLTVWAGSHFFGIGEIVDVVLLTVGVVGLGFAVFEGAGALYDFTTVAISARSDSQLDVAARHFARAVTLLGVSTLQALLLRGQGRSIIARGRPRVYPRPNVGVPPPSGNQLRLARPAQVTGGTLGETKPFGQITVARNQSLDEQRVTLFHELVHRYFSPRTGPLRRLRAELAWSAYSRSAFLRYLEETLAEGYGQLRVHGFARALGSYRFPINGGYVTVSELVGEGRAVGTITLGGALFYVSVSPGQLPSKHQ
jgi:hypothetical protein